MSIMVDAMVSVEKPDAPEKNTDKPQWRIVGKVTNWNMSNPLSPEPIGTEETFSMFMLDVDRSKLTPTIKPFSVTVSPDDLEKEMAEQREADREEAEQLRKLIEDVRRLKRTGQWHGPLEDYGDCLGDGDS